MSGHILLTTASSPLSSSIVVMSDTDTPDLRSPSPSPQTIHNIPKSRGTSNPTVCSPILNAVDASPTSSSKQNKKLFPQKLWELINDNKYNFCLRWSDDGQLVYLNRDEFEDSYLKTSENQFHTQKAISFVRQMNMYGFRKVDDCYYENDNFKRDCQHLLKNMIRKHPNKSAATTTAAAAATVAAANNALHQPTNCSANDAEVAQNLHYGAYAHFDQHQQQVIQSHHHHQQHPQQANGLTASSSSVIMSQQLANPCLMAASHMNSNSSSSSACSLSSSFSSSSSCASSVGTEHHTFNLSGAGNCEDYLALQQQQIPLNLPGQPNAGNGLGGAFLDQKDLIKAIISQQENTQLLRELANSTNNNHTTAMVNSPTNNAFNANLSALYALLASINGSPYQPVSSIDHSSHTSSIQPLDFGSLGNIQHLYQNIVAQQSIRSDPHSNILQSPINFSHSTSTANQNKSIISKSSASDRHMSIPELASDISLLRAPVSPHTQYEIAKHSGYEFISGTDECENKTADTSNKVIVNNYLEPVSRRRDIKSSRCFKRSIDSILDSNNNTNTSTNAYTSNNLLKSNEIFNKKARLEVYPNDGAGIQKLIIEKEISKSAQNLVSQIALLRDARLDANVIIEASRYTERFIETLFDTAQLISRHSNGPSSTEFSSMAGPDISHQTEEKDFANNDSEIYRGNINMSDLTSALKILPSKLSKILK